MTTNWIPFPRLSFNFDSQHSPVRTTVEYGVIEGICIGGVYQTPNGFWGWFLDGVRPPSPRAQYDMYQTKKEAQDYVLSHHESKVS